MKAMAPHWIPLEGAANARAVVPGVLLRSDNLQGLTKGDLRRLVEQESLEVVLDLRTGVEVELEGPGPMAAQPGVRIEHLSLYQEAGRTDEHPGDVVEPEAHPDSEDWPAETPVVSHYLSYLRRRPDSIVESVRTIARARGAVLVHCAAGKDRTGVVVAMALDAAGVDHATIVADYLASRERIEAIMDRLVRSPTYRDELEGDDPWDHAPLPGTMERVLELIEERFGGSAAWLTAHGLSADDLARLRRRLSPAQAAA
jgi:protein-tyrosine phosphatase